LAGQMDIESLCILLENRCGRFKHRWGRSQVKTQHCTAESLGPAPVRDDSLLLILCSKGPLTIRPVTAGKYSAVVIVLGVAASLKRVTGFFGIRLSTSELSNGYWLIRAEM
jgi:hypothetical protein